jgi:hypothetical protein
MDPARDADGTSWNRGGRSVRWRLGMLLGGAALAGLGAVVWLWPAVLVGAVAAACVLLGLLLVLSGVFARGR